MTTRGFLPFPSNVGVLVIYLILFEK